MFHDVRTTGNQSTVSKNIATIADKENMPMPHATSVNPLIPKMAANSRKFAIVVIIIQIIFIICFAFFVEYGEDMDAASPKNFYLDSSKAAESNLHQYYPMFQDANMMIFFGVGFLYSFLAKYGYSGVGLNFIISAVAMEWSLLAHEWWNSVNGKIRIDITSFISGEFSAASAVIAIGGVFAKVGPLQIVVFTLIEVLLYTANEHFCVTAFKISDVGGSVSLHMFAGIFGCAAAYTLDKGSVVQNNPNERTSYSSNLFTMVGTLLLWAYWPSFNAALSSSGNLQYRSVVNTYLSLLGSCVAVFAVTTLIQEEKKFTMSHIQNATLAGGVAIGATADLMVQPYGALLIGSIAGTLSVLGFQHFSPFLAKFKIYDPCGINSLHAIPGFFAGISSIVLAFMATEEKYGHNLYKLYPAMAPYSNTSSLIEIQSHSPDVQPGFERSPQMQACFQFLYVVEVMAAAVATGLATGFLLRSKMFDPLEEKHMYLDEVLWVMPECKEKTKTTSINNSTSHL
ncbi:hypothetical protein JTE90_017668 [Oedothorax gibbosus]|uniref:Ammonium transporter AmtB-like domain-containing protein n=1 Tax=Oedothorax gibbosus TaxID=931172 RepID=A0AAV6UGJ9_9ARAC|nr:hypothetical protein JTE90_017668 [Oedothorax gibbosus]